MSNVLYFPNIRSEGGRPTATGTQVTDAAASTKICLDTFVRNDNSNPIFISSSTKTVLETRFHDCSSTTINAVGGAFVEIATAAALANTIKLMKVACTFGEPISIRKAANAGAAATASDIALLNQGQSDDFEVSLVAGDRLWVRSRTSSNITSGYLTINLLG